MAAIIEKQAWILNTIRRFGPITFNEINQRWINNTELNPYAKDFTTRTFHRHRNDINNLYGIEIKCNKSRNAYYIDEQSTKTDVVKSWLLDTIAIDNLLKENREIHNRILVEQIHSGQDSLYKIISAMKSSHKLQIVYYSYSSNESYSTCLSPYFLKVFSQRWYVIGLTDKYQEELRTYALDRILSAEITTDKFKYPKNFRPDDFFADRIGVFHDNEKPVKIKIKVYNEQRNFIRSRPLHQTQQEIVSNDEQNYSIFLYRICIDENLISAILSRGSLFEVIEPQSLRNEIRRRGENIIARYKI